MDLILYNIVVIFVYFVGFGFCGDPQDITSCDPEEFDVNDLLNDPLVIEALESNETNVEEEPSQHKPSQMVKKISLERQNEFHNYSLYSRKFISLGPKYKGDSRMSNTFNRLKPAKLNPYGLSMMELENKFHEMGDEHTWEELLKYPLINHTSYWAHVCDYFWMKEYHGYVQARGCYINMFIFPFTMSQIVYYDNLKSPTMADLLRCKCYFYSKNRSNPISDAVDFAVHKYKGNEYFILIKVPKYTYGFSVAGLFTEAILPMPPQ